MVRFDVLSEVPQMARVPAIIPVSDLRQGAADVLAKVRKSRQPVVITQRGRAAAVMISMESYEEREREREILRRIAQGEREISKGRGIDLAEVLAEADRLIAK
jgi:prevent-host-death family protein